MKDLRHFMLLMVMAVCAVAATTSCSSDDDGPKLDPPVTVTIADNEIESEKATVTVTPSDNDGEWYCALFTAGEAKEMTDEQVVDKLTSTTASPTKPQKGTQSKTWANLTPQAAYTIVAFGWNGKEASAVVRHDITTPEVKPEQVASAYFDVDYWADVYHNGYDNFIVYFGDAPHDGVVIKGMGTIYTISIYNKTAADKSNPMPQEGEYTMISPDATEPTDFCIEPGESRRFIVTAYDESDGSATLKDAQLQDAKATIKKVSDTEWSLDVVIVDPEGVKKEFTYTGKVNLKDRSFKGYEGPTINEDKEFVADYCEGYNYTGTQFGLMDGGDPYAEGASWFNRNRLFIRLNCDAAVYEATGLMVPPIGTFEVSDKEEPGYVFNGTYSDLGSGAAGPEGTYYGYMAYPGFTQYYAFVRKGSITISKDKDDIYTIKCNFITEQGKKMEATYTGKFPVSADSSAKPAFARQAVKGRTPKK